jgi:hypothetical protein
MQRTRRQAGLVQQVQAAMSRQAGARAAVIEAGRVGVGATGYTTAKITSLHSQIYAQLQSKFGEDGARTYGHANEAS